MSFTEIDVDQTLKPEDHWSCKRSPDTSLSPGIYFNAFIHVYSPRAGADNPLGTNVDVNRKPLSLWLQVLKQSL